MAEDFNDDELRDLGRQFAKIRRSLPDLPDHEPRNLSDAPRLEIRPRSDEGDMRTPQLRPVFDIGQIGTIVSILVTAVGTIWWGSTTVATVTQQISHQTEQILKLQGDVVAINASTVERERRYGPRVDKVEADNQVQNERLTNAAASILELRRQGTDLMAVLSVMREDIASIKASRYYGPSRRTELVSHPAPVETR